MCFSKKAGHREKYSNEAKRDKNEKQGTLKARTLDNY
jgi:hypothetical protein